MNLQAEGKVLLATSGAISSLMALNTRRILNSTLNLTRNQGREAKRSTVRSILLILIRIPAEAAGFLFKKIFYFLTVEN